MEPTAATRDAARRAAELAARDAYGRLLAYLAGRTRDVAAAEDALGEAFRAALEQWPRDGVPDRPDAWLLTAARRRIVDEHRRSHVRARLAPAVAGLIEDLSGRPPDEHDAVPDRRLELLFVCTHPAIAAASRAPLMLQAVLGLDAARVAAAFLVAPTAMAQRLVRAKAKIRDAGIAFDPPPPSQWPARVGAVLDAIYGAYGSGWDDVAAAGPDRGGLVDEALWLAELVCARLPESAEAHGLLALLQFCEARRPARRDRAGAYVPLGAQDVARWSSARIAAAEAALATAAALRDPGPWQLEAAIQSAHVHGRLRGATPWPAIVALYDALLAYAPTIGAQVSRAAALSQAGDPDAALAQLDALPPTSIASYQPYWAVRAHALRTGGHAGAARDAYARAAGLATDPAVRRFLLDEQAAIERSALP